MSDKLRKALENAISVIESVRESGAVDADDLLWLDRECAAAANAGYIALAARHDSPTLDVQRLVDAMNDAYEYVNDDYVPALPFMDDIEAFWRPFAAKVLAALAAEAPERPAPETRKQRERDLMASNHAIGRHRGGRPVQGCPLCEDPA